MGIMFGSIVIAVIIFPSICVNGQTAEEKKEVLLGKPATLDCSSSTVNDQNVLMGDLDLNKGEGAKRIFFKKMEEFQIVDNNLLNEAKLTVQDDEENKKVTLKIPEVKNDLEGIKLTCFVKGASGLGATISTKTWVIKVVDPPKVTVKTNFDTTDEVKVARDSKKDVVLTCSATGRPKPSLKWIRKAAVDKTSGTKAGEDKDVTSETVEDAIQMTLKSPIKIEDDGEYECKAEVNSELLKKKKLSEVSKTVRVLVQYKPTLTIGKGTIYTDLKMRESLKISVSGNPQPQLNCSMLSLTEPKLMRVTPFATHNKLVYDIVILEVKEKDIGEYKCTASNDQGSVSDTIRLSLKPSKPRIMSPKSTKYSDYYQLHWNVTSRAPMRNVTVEILLRKEDNTTTVLRKDTFTLKPDDRVFSHHIANLTQNATHELRLKACNSRGCDTQETAHAFRTQKYDGKNKVDVAILKEAVTVSPRTGNVKGPVGLASPICSLSWGVIALCALLIYNH